MNGPLIMIPGAGITAIGSITGDATVILTLNEIPQNGTLITILEGISVNGTFTVALAQPDSCKKVRAEVQQTSTELRVLIITDDTGCKSKISRGALIGIVCGAVGLTIAIGILMALAFAYRERLPTVSKVLFRRRRRPNKDDMTLYV